MDRKHSRRNNSRNPRLIEADKRRKSVVALAFPRHVFSLMLMALLIFGMVSFTFAFIADNVLPSVEEGKMIMSEGSSAAARDNEDIGRVDISNDSENSDGSDAELSFFDSVARSVDLAATGADMDLAETGWYWNNGTYYMKGDFNNWGNLSGTVNSSNTQQHYYYVYMPGSSTDSYFEFKFKEDDGSGNESWFGFASANTIGTSGKELKEGNDGGNNIRLNRKDLGTDSSKWYKVKVWFEHKGTLWTWYDKETTKDALSTTLTTKKGTTETTEFSVGDTVSLSAATSNNFDTVNYSYEYKIGSGNYQTINGTSFTPASNGTYTIRVTATDSAVVGGTNSVDDRTTTATKTITVYPVVASSVALTADPSSGYIDAGYTQVTYSAAVTGLVPQSGVKYNFKVNGTSVQNTSSSTYVRTYASAGTYNVTVTVECANYSSVTSNTVTTTVTTPTISSFTIDDSTSKTLKVNETATLASAKTNSDNNVTYEITAQSPTSGSGNVISLSGTTVTAIQPGTATITASLTHAVSKTVSVTVSQPTISPSDALTVYIDQTGGVSAAPTFTPTGTSVTYTSGNTSYYTVNSSGLVTPVSFGTADLSIAVQYNSTYSKTFTRSVVVSPRGIYLVGLKNEYDWVLDDDNKMTYNSDTGLYEITRNLYPYETTYGGTNQTSPNANTSFAVNIGTTDNKYGANSSGYTINTMQYNTVTLTHTNYKKICLKTKDISAYSTEYPPYKFTFNYTNNQLKVYYPMGVSFDMKGHGTAIASQVVIYGETADQPTAPTETGYTFGGWYTDTDCTNAFSFSTAITDDTTLYAKWTPAQSTVTYNKNASDATAGIPATATATYGLALPTITTLPSRTGYTFKGYFDGTGNNAVKYYNNDSTAAKTAWDKTASNVTLYAQWEAKTSALTFNLNGGSASSKPVDGTLVATYGQAMPTYNTATYPVPSRTGYTFLGYYDGTGSSAVKYYNANLTSARAWDKNITTATTLYAQWQINQYQVDFAGKYRSGSASYSNNFTTIPSGALKITVSGTDYTPPHSFDYNSSVTLTANNAITGYTFDGIYNSNGTKVSSGTSNTYTFTLSNSNVTYYAYYTKNLAVDTLTYTATDVDANDRPTTMAVLSFSATASGGLGGYTYTYYYSTDDGANWTLIQDPTSWRPTTHLTYKFKVVAKDSANTTAEKIISVEVVKYNTTFAITTTAHDVTGVVTYQQIDTMESPPVTTNIGPNDTQAILGGSTMNMSIARPTNIQGHSASDYYFSSVSVTMNNTTLWTATNVFDDITLQQLTTNVSGPVTVEYTLSLKPCITITSVANVASYSFTYVSDSTQSTVTSAGSYYVDYGTAISYTAAPASGYFIESISDTATAISPAVASQSPSTTSITVTTSSVTTGNELTAHITGNKNVTVNLAAGSSGGSLSVGSVQNASFSTPYPLEYNTPTTVTITPPGGYYVSNVTVTSGSASYNAPSSYDSGAFVLQNLRLTTSDVVFSVTYTANPVIHLVQPQYGSIYITSLDENDDTVYHFDGDSVEYNTELTIHVHADADSSHVYNTDDDPFFTIDGVYYQRAGAQQATLIDSDVDSPSDNLTHTIQADTTFTADISYALSSVDVPEVARGYRRILLTDNQGWSGSDGTDPVYVHYSNGNSSFAIGNSSDDLHNNVRMQCLYLDEGVNGMPVLYADIPQSYRYVFFFQGGSAADPSSYMDVTTCVPLVYSAYGTVTLTDNAFSTDISGSSVPYQLSNMWNCCYEDFQSVGSAGDQGDKQQMQTSLNKAAEFSYKYDYGDSSLDFDVIAGDDCNVTFNNGVMKITPTTNTHGYAFVEVSSGTSGNAKYYLIRINNFEFHSQSTPQKLYKPASSLNVLIKTLVSSAGTLTYADTYSKNNINFSTLVTSLSNQGTETENLITYVMRKVTFAYSTYNFEGITYLKTVAEDNAGNSDERTSKTVFDLASASGSGVIYFNNSTLLSLDDYDLVARFTCIANNTTEYKYVTMRKVNALESRYRVAVPANADSVTFYLMYTDVSPEDTSHVEDTYTNTGSTVYYFSKSEDYEIGNDRVFEVSEISYLSIEGDFVGY